MLKCVQGVTSHIEKEIPFLVLEYTFIYGFLESRILRYTVLSRIYTVYFILLVRFLNRKSGHTCSEIDEAAREDGLATHRALAPAIGQHDHAVAAVLAHAAVAAWKETVGLGCLHANDALQSLSGLPLRLG